MGMDCKDCVNCGSNKCPLLKGESLQNIIKYQCPIYEKFSLEDMERKAYYELQAKNLTERYLSNNPNLKFIPVLGKTEDGQEYISFQIVENGQIKDIDMEL